MKAPRPHFNGLQQMALILFAAVVMFYHLIPFTLIPATWPAPDILFCVICGLIIRRPEIVPFGVVAIIYFGFDIFLMRPLGIWTACILVATEILRANRDAFRENLFPYEWFSVSLIFLLTLIGKQAFLAVTFVPAPPLWNIFWTFLFTVLAYPVVLFVITYILRIRKPVLGAFNVQDQKP